MSINDRRMAGQSPFSADFPSASASEEPFFVEIGDNPPREASALPTVEVEQPPNWFRGPAKPAPPPPPPKSAPPATRRQPSTPSGSPPPSRRLSPILPPSEDDPEEELPWHERFKKWVLGEGGAGYGISVLVHVILLLMMSLWIMTIPKNEDLVTTLDQTEPADLASIQDVEIVELDTDFEPQMKDPLFEPAPLSAPDIGIGTLTSSLLEKKGGGLELKIPQQAVTKGSFTVWTEPEDPLPGQSYRIWIQVKLKNEIKRYPRSDLNGNIVGTDGYKDYFGGPTEAGYLPIKDNTVRYEALTVPGAAQLVKDVINVESKILKEKQMIELVF